MIVTVRAISDLKAFPSIRGLWDSFVKMHSDFPLLFSGFLELQLKTWPTKGWMPLFLLLSVDDKTIGIASLQTRRRFGLRYARFRSTPFLIVADKDHISICVSTILDFLFDKEHYHFVDLRSFSAQAKLIRRACKQRGIHLSEVRRGDQAIIPVDRSWNEFAGRLGKKFRQDIRRTERRLSDAGPWKCVGLDLADATDQVLWGMRRVERNTWKYVIHARRDEREDEKLADTWRWLQNATRSIPNLKGRVWLLELDQNLVAYLLVCMYKGVAFLLGTSYDQNYARFDPGIFVLNNAFREIFNGKRAFKIEFMSGYPFSRTWDPVCSQILEYTMTSGRGLSRILSQLRASVFGRKLANVAWYFLVEASYIKGDVSKAFPLLDLFV